MADFDQKAYDDITSELKKASGELGRIANRLGATNSNNGSTSQKDGSLAKARRKVEAELNKHAKVQKTLNDRVTDASDHFDSLSGNMDQFGRSISRFAKVIPGGVLIGAMAAWGKNLVDKWREMADVGQTFNGSMFGMARAAADAGLPLGEFAEVVKKNSKVMSVFGQKHVTDLMKNVRKAAQEQGLYGMTMEQLNGVAGDYLEMQRMMGNKQAATSVKTEKSIANFAKTLGSLAAATGTSRDEIMKATMGIMSDIAIATKYFGKSGFAAQDFADNTMKAVATLAALPGKAGDILSKMLGDAAGYGTSLFSDGAETFINAGLGQMVGATDKLATAIQQGGVQAEAATSEYLIDFKKQVEANMTSLRLQAQTGNQSARQVLEMYTQIAGMTDDQIKNMAKQQTATKNMTAFFSSISNVLKSLFGNVFGRIMEHFENIDANMTNIFQSDTFKAMEDTFVSLGIKLGDWLRNLKPEDIKAWADTFQGGINVFLGLLDIVGKVGHVLTNVAQWVDGAWEATFGKIFGEGKGSLVGALTAGILLLFGPKLIGGAFKMLIKGLFPKSRDAYITADDVYVNGDPIGGGFGGGGRGRGGRGLLGRGAGRVGSRAKAMARVGGRGARGLLGRVGGIAGGVMGIGASMFAPSIIEDVIDGTEALGQTETKTVGKEGAKLAEKGVGKAATKGAIKAGEKGLLKGLGKGLGKTILKKIPLLGLGAGLVFGAQRLMGGDWKGAGLEALSGLASTVPGIGTAASLGIDAALMARDVVGPENADKALGDMVKGVSDQTTAIQKSVAENSATAQTDQNLAQEAEYRKEMRKMQEQQLAMTRQMVETLNRIARTNRDVANNTAS